ncbi:type I restriction endonuclease subunit R [Candidatus Marinimicrobia bacterium]|nr:type I restriction endonuclease subunit R [Candidatus Neomarinimicrobiota bacterium]
MINQGLKKLQDRSALLSEDQFEFECLQFFKELGWEYAYAKDEKESNSFLGRNSFDEVVLQKYLLPSLKRLNPNLSEKKLQLTIKELCQNKTNIEGMTKANQSVYKLIKDGVKITYSEEGKQKTKSVKIIDFKEPENNHFLAVGEFNVRGNLGKKRPDIIGFVNGLPLIIIELKAIDQKIKKAYDNNLKDYKTTLPYLFQYNTCLVVSNGDESKVGSLTSGWEHFNEWKKIHNETEKPNPNPITLFNGIFNKKYFLDILENFILFTLDEKNNLIKIFPKNHQFLGVNASIESFKNRKKNGGKLGVFWHTQGAGKSISMVFFSEKILRKISGNWKFVIVTDRNELDKQIYQNYLGPNLIRRIAVRADSIAHLRELLSQDNRYVFTLIHKFQVSDEELLHPELIADDNVIVMTDEAHRSQYATLAMNMRSAMPKANFLAFTGTPLIDNDGNNQKTKEVFGDYVSTYNFAESVKDKATVPLYYENRTPEVEIKNEELDQDLEGLINTFELESSEEKKLNTRIAKQYHIITRNERLDSIAKDIVEHFINRYQQGKAMVVSIDIPTCVIMYDKVQIYWKNALEELKKSNNELYQIHKNTDMAVVVSQSQNEEERLNKKGTTIVNHRERMLKGGLDSKFKDRDDPLKIIFVCSMWITGFNVPSISTIYLDKPMKNHTLMQTIARANRVFPNKESGLIVSYINLFKNLQNALATYADGEGIIGSPISDKKELKDLLVEELSKTEILLSNYGINLEKIDFNDISSIRREIVECREKILIIKSEFGQCMNNIELVYKKYMPSQLDNKIYLKIRFLKKLKGSVNSLNPEIDVTEEEQKIEELLDRSIGGYEINKVIGSDIVDLSNIDLDGIKDIFNSKQERTAIEILKNKLKKEIKLIICFNPSRISLFKKLEKLIEDYNDGTQSLDIIFKQLQKIKNEVSIERKKFIEEGFNCEEERAVYELLELELKDLSIKDKKLLKSHAQTIHKLFVEKIHTSVDWKEKVQKQAQLKRTIITKTIAGLKERIRLADLTDKIYDYYHNLTYQPTINNQ